MNRRVLSVFGPVAGETQSGSVYVASGRPTLTVRYDAPVVVTLHRFGIGRTSEVRYEGAEIGHLLPAFRSEHIRMTVEGTANGYAEIGF